MAWTPEQQKAIDTRDRTLLVSAAAGSGKTATLTERIIQSILDDENPQDIGRMLIATYTNAAVDELRERIGKAIKTAAAANPDNARLEGQLLRLKDAKILTITSFCNSILRQSAESVGLSPNYRIAEPPEAKILASEVLDGLIEAAYAGDIPEVVTAEEFIALADCLSNVKYSDGLRDTIAYIFEKLTYTEAGIDTLADFIKEYDPKDFTTVDNTRYGKSILDEVKLAASEYVAAYGKIMHLAGTERIDERNLKKAEEELAFIKRASELSTYEDLKAHLATYTLIKYTRTGKEEPTDFYVAIGTIHKYFYEDYKKFSADYFVYDTKEWHELYGKLYNLLTYLYKFLKKYYEVFLDAKRRRGIVEFSDVERFAYLALHDENGNPSDLAKELSEKFDAIYVDEYQDVNSLQGKVFSAISKPNNRFMVGDIKQSIYCFRSARPDIFRGMKETFPLIDTEGDYPAASIFMSNNFRCDKPVVDFVNGVFDTMFGLLGKSIGYVPNDRLMFSKIYPKGSTPTGHIPEIHIIEKPKKKTAAEGEETDYAEEIIKEEKNANRVQAAAIAKKVRVLIDSGTLADGSRIEPKHIAILMRSVKSEAASTIADALASHGIASSIAECGNLFMCDEVLLALSFLYAIDNPGKDVYLTAIMLSPLFGFSADELVKIRRSGDYETLWDALLGYSESDPENAKIKDFIQTLLYFRKLSEGLSTDALISAIYQKTGLYALGVRCGGGDNLTLLHSYAKKYEQSDFKGLYSFINYVNAIIDGKQEFPSANDGEAANAVSIMTVHKSKGLEFPVTIIAGAGSGFGGGAEGRIVFSDDFGIALRTKDDSGLAIVDNPVAHAIESFIKKGEFDEELRVLYVALTRAREMLYVYAVSPRGTAEEYVESIDTLREILSPYIATKAHSFLDIIMLGRNCGKLIIEASEEASEEASDGDSDAKSGTSDTSEILDTGAGADADEYLGRFSFRYPYAHLETLPEKISVSRLSPTVLDGNEKDGADLAELLYYISGEGKDNSDEAGSPETLPSFITGTGSRESAERGIATHTVMQFCDFDKLEKNGPESELKRLVDLEFISEKDAERVRISELQAFVESPLFREMKEAKQLYRELRFNVKLPAAKFASDESRRQDLSEENVLVQGVIDCIIEKDDGSLHLIDYKTDRLTREERECAALGEKKLRDKHTLQLSYYRDAIKIMFGKEPTRIGVYSLHLGREVEIFLD